MKLKFYIYLNKNTSKLKIYKELPDLTFVREIVMSVTTTIEIIY